MLVQLSAENAVTTLTLNDPRKRNAMSLPMFDALDEALARIRTDNATRVLLIAGEGDAFCAGFDLAAAVEQPALIGTYIHRLSHLLRTLRRLPQIVVAAAHGHAVAGGCALLSACDFVFVTADATLGYPVHALGVSPAVTIPTLRQVLGDGAARSLLVSGELIDGSEAARRGLASHVVPQRDTLRLHALAHCHALAAKPPHALRTTKSWLNQLDGSLLDTAFDGVAHASATASQHPEHIALLQRFWVARKR